MSTSFIRPLHSYFPFIKQYIRSSGLAKEKEKTKSGSVFCPRNTYLRFLESQRISDLRFLESLTHSSPLRISHKSNQSHEQCRFRRKGMLSVCNLRNQAGFTTSSSTIHNSFIIVWYVRAWFYLITFPQED